MKRALVLGASGLIGSHMAIRLKAEGYHVRALSRNVNKSASEVVDEYWACDLRERHGAMFEGVDEVYQFAAEVGGLGYIMNSQNDVAVLRNTTMIDLNVLEACRLKQVPKVFFASSACVYTGNKRFFAEQDAYPANPINEFAWQKLFAERLYRAYAENYGIDVRIGRLFNTYGVGMTWTGGREKSVAALCRKIAEAKDGDAIEVWGSGEQARSYMYIEDCIEGIWRFMQSPADPLLNIGPQFEVTIRDLINAIRRIANKRVFCSFDSEAPTGMRRICSDNTAIRQVLGWEPKITIEQGLQTVYPWIEKLVLDRRKSA